MPVKAKSKEDQLHRIPLRITDTTLRDAHQSLWATRMRIDEIMKIIDVVDNVGYYSLEVWGGATFDVCLRFLRENPWERLRMIKKKTPKTPLQMLLRGQNLVGYRNYADDLVDRFVALSIENGIDIFRVFDALNDARNLESAIKAVKKYGGHAQGTLSYTISPVHTVDLFVKAAKDQLAMGIDSLVVKDMAGILSPIRAEKLVSALVKEVKIPIQLHCHASSGMGVPSYVEGVRAGAGAIDCAISAMAGFSSQPPVETMVAIFKETDYSAELDVDALRRINKHFEAIHPIRTNTPAHRPIIDPEVLIHQIPGGMISNFRSQLQQQGALDRLPEAQEEVARVRKDFGYPPLVTPSSQIVGTQAVLNVLAGERYKMVPNEVKNYVRGYYGRPPVPLDPKFIKQILGDEKPIDHRPADDIEPMLPDAAKDVDPKLIKEEEDIVAYAILPEPSLEYFKWRALPPEQRPLPPVETEQPQAKAAPKPEVPKAAPVKSKAETLLSPKDYGGIGELLGKAGKLSLDELVVKKGDFSLTLRSGPESSLSTQEEATKEESPQEETPPEESKAAEEPEVDVDNSIPAPFSGTFYRASGPGKPPLSNEGDFVQAGDPVCVVEAMKLFNEIKAPEGCKLVKFLASDGDKVEKDQPLIAVE